MKVHVHNFEPLLKGELIMEDKKDKIIREFATFVKDNIPDHVTSFTLIVHRDGYMTTVSTNEFLPMWNER